MWNRHGIKIRKGYEFKWYLEWHGPYEVETFDWVGVAKEVGVVVATDSP